MKIHHLHGECALAGWPNLKRSSERGARCKRFLLFFWPACPFPRVLGVLYGKSALAVCFHTFCIVVSDHPPKMASRFLLATAIAVAVGCVAVCLYDVTPVSPLC